MTLIFLRGILILFKVAGWENNPFRSGWLAVKKSPAFFLFPRRLIVNQISHNISLDKKYFARIINNRLGSVLNDSQYIKQVCNKTVFITCDEIPQYFK